MPLAINVLDLGHSGASILAIRRIRSGRAMRRWLGGFALYTKQLQEIRHRDILVVQRKHLSSGTKGCTVLSVGAIYLKRFFNYR